MIGVKYTGAAIDASGYGEAVRHDIASLIDAGINITTEIPRFSLELTDFGKLSDLATQRDGARINYKIKILHVTPNIIGKYIEPNKYHIMRMIWETDKLPPDFARPLERVQEIWTASEYTKKAIINSGVNKPIYIIPEAIDTSIDYSGIPIYSSGIEDTYKFYSIFEFTERKNPKALLEAYWTEFKNDEKVSLTIKTFIDSYHPEKKREIIDIIRNFKNGLGSKWYAPVYIYNRLLDRHQMYRFHKSFDCFVSAHRGEGWGIPQMEAMLIGNPIISTNCGGIHEYLENNEHAKLINFKMVKVEGNNRNQQWYLSDQNWAEIDIIKLRKAMRECYEKQQEARIMGERAKNLIKDKFSIQEVGKIMKKRLNEIVN